MNEPLLAPMPDGYWTSWHIAEARLREVEAERDRYLKLNQALVQRDTPHESRTKDYNITHLKHELAEAEASLTTLATVVREVEQEMALVVAAPKQSDWPGLALVRRNTIQEWLDTLRAALPKEGQP